MQTKPVGKTPITYYGGKQRMLRHILPLIPNHILYCEPFVGGAAVYFAKEPSVVEVVNDTNEALITFYKVAKEHPRKLIKRVKTTLHSRKSHDKAWDIYCNPTHYTEIDLAWAVWVLCSHGFASQISKVWGYDKSRNTMAKRIQNAKMRFDLELCSRLEATQLECKDAIEVIKKYDNEDTFHYVDPPYFNSDCGHYKGYSEDDFKALLEILSNIKGKFLLSSYMSNILTEYTQEKGWHQKTFKQSVSVNAKSGKAKNKIEVLTSNYPL